MEHLPFYQKERFILFKAKISVCEVVRKVSQNSRGFHLFYIGFSRFRLPRVAPWSENEVRSREAPRKSGHLEGVAAQETPVTLHPVGCVHSVHRRRLERDAVAGGRERGD